MLPMSDQEQPVIPSGVYRIVMLSDALCYIHWAQDASLKDGYQFVADLERILNQRPNKIYFISDLRLGCITQVEVLRKLSHLGAHPNWGGGTSFVSPTSSIFSRFFDRLQRAHRQEDATWPTPEQAITYIEMLSPGITKGIDWERVLAGEFPEAKA